MSDDVYPSIACAIVGVSIYSADVMSVGKWGQLPAGCYSTWRDACLDVLWHEKTSAAIGEFAFVLLLPFAVICLYDIYATFTKEKS